MANEVFGLIYLTIYVFAFIKYLKKLEIVSICSHSNSIGALLFCGSVLIWSPRASKHIHHTLVFNLRFSQRGGGAGIPKLNVKFQWPLFLALKPDFFLAKSDILIPECTG